MVYFANMKLHRVGGCYQPTKILHKSENVSNSPYKHQKRAFSTISAIA